MLCLDRQSQCPEKHIRRRLIPMVGGTRVLAWRALPAGSLLIFTIFA